MTFDTITTQAWLAAVVGLLALLTLVFGVFTVSQQNVAVIQRFGKFLRVAKPGLQFKIPWVDFVAGHVNLRVQQLDVRVETKTADNVFVHVIVSVQYFVVAEKVYEAFYKLADADKQITAFVFDVVRARVPGIKLDDVFEKKDEIADAVRDELAGVMDDFGYGIVKALVTDIDPDAKVKESMNEINAAQRMRMAAQERGEAERILRVKNAEAEAQSKALQGRGVADQRKAIAEGLSESVQGLTHAMPGATAQDLMQLILLTQYFDTLKDIAHSSRTNTILLPHGPGHVADLGAQVRNAMIVAGEVGRLPEEPPAV